MKDKRDLKKYFKYKIIIYLILILNHLEEKRKKERRNLDFEAQVSHTNKLPMGTVLLITDVYIP